MIRHIMPSRNEQKWTEQKKRLLIQFTELTNEDLLFEAGRKYQMFEKIGFKLGKTESEMDIIIQSL